MEHRFLPSFLLHNIQIYHLCLFYICQARMRSFRQQGHCVRQRSYDERVCFEMDDKIT